MKNIIRNLLCGAMLISLAMFSGCSKNDDTSEILTNTSGSPMLVTTLTDDEGEIIAVTTATDDKGETITDSKGSVVTQTVTLKPVTSTSTSTSASAVTTVAPTSPPSSSSSAVSKVSTAVATTTTKKVTTVATTTTTKRVTTTTAPAVSNENGVLCSTVFNIDGENITVKYYEKAPSNPTLQAYSDLAQYGVLTDEIRQLITDDIMNYAISRYGAVKDTSKYANSLQDWNGSFHNGEPNSGHSRGLQLNALMISWGAMSEDCIDDSLDTYAKTFQQKCYDWVDYTFETLEANGYTDFKGWGCNVGFCRYRETVLDNGSVYTEYYIVFVY